MKRLLCSIFGCNEKGPLKLLAIAPPFDRLIVAHRRVVVRLKPDPDGEVSIWQRLCSRCGR